MTAHNFTLIRDKNHQVWKHTSGAQVVVGKTISDARAFKNIERDIRKVLNNTEFAFAWVTMGTAAPYKDSATLPTWSN